VVQEHQARRRHFDLRLEWNGVLLSWAVPKGPSLDPSEKRLAVRVEDHPTDYADFEGSIPEGNYGAGAMIVWDQGRWLPVEDPARGLESGKLLFDLFGYKLRGRFTLVRTRRRGAREPSNEWLLIKKPDAFATADALSPLSVHSGLDVEARAAGASPEPRCCAAARAGATRRRVSLGDVRPMLATPWPEPFASPDWLFELKYDGYRALATREDDRTRIVYRSGRDVTARFPEIAVAIGALPVGHAIFDGELVVPDAAGRPSFSLLQNRAQASASDAARSAVESPATYWIFDLLALGGLDLRPLPLRVRKALLERIVPPFGPLRRAPHWTGRGREVYREIEKLGFEGMLATRIDAPYCGRRDAAWRMRALRSGVRDRRMSLRAARAAASARCIWRPRQQAAALRRPRRQRLRRSAASHPRGDARAGPARDAGVCRRHAEGTRQPLGRAASAGRGALRGVDAGPAAPAARLPASARRQARRRVRDGPRRGGRCPPRARARACVRSLHRIRRKLVLAS
jgi:bifunctional non-homologous end joining protein LigD